MSFFIHFVSCFSRSLDLYLLYNAMQDCGGYTEVRSSLKRNQLGLEFSLQLSFFFSQVVKTEALQNKLLAAMAINTTKTEEVCFEFNTLIFMRIIVIPI